MKFFNQFKGLRPTRRAHNLVGLGVVLLAMWTFLIWVNLAAGNYHG